MNTKSVLACCIAVCAALQAFAEPSAPADLNAALVERNALVARRAAAEGMALLKNTGSALPLAKGGEIALFGAFKDFRTGGGGSSNLTPVRVVDIPAGLKEAGFVISQETRETALFVVVRKSGEGRDNTRDAFTLGKQELKELSDVKAMGFKRIVVVCNCAHAISLKAFADDPAISAIVWMWCPGGEGGAALGDVLAGKVNPSGRLADTFAAGVADYPSDRGFCESRWYEPYEEDIFVGYRYFETIPGAKEKVVYPFGFGLSYTTFAVEPVLKDGGAVDSAAATVSVSVKVTNTGSVPGRNSVLCYTSQKGGEAEHPAIELRAYAKTRLLQPGESQTLDISFAAKDLAYFDDEGASGHAGSWVIDSGSYSVLVGGSVRDVAEAGAFAVAEPIVVSSPGFKLSADRLARRMRANGKYDTANVAYPGVFGGDNGAKDVRTNEIETVKWTLFDVADGKATLDEFLDQMTLHEMLHLLYGHPKHDPSGTGSIGDLAKFGISAAQTCDGPAGVRRSKPSSYFPCAALLAQTFDPALLEEIGAVIGAEAADVDFDILLAPGLCIHRHPLCGRNFEYFSEDPLVSGVSAGNYVKGVQSQGVGATLKHFAGNDRETTRKIEKDIVSERAFREIHLRGFERAIAIGSPWAIMTAYNGMNGFNASENHGLLTGILRDEWGFDGLTMTDWATTVPIWREIEAGNDVKMPNEFTDVLRHYSKPGDGIKEAVHAWKRGFLSVGKVRESAKRVCSLVVKSRRFAREKAKAAAKRNESRGM